MLFVSLSIHQEEVIQLRFHVRGVSGALLAQNFTKSDRGKFVFVWFSEIATFKNLETVSIHVLYNLSKKY